MFAFDKPVVEVILDPSEETADLDTGEQLLPRKPQMSKFELFIAGRHMPRRPNGRNPMQAAKKEGQKAGN
ncbi:MAG: hypothetical protein IPK21_21805 [Haliscomenobacter sp.]|nr:hypothetical protein [Haliscomenobacter sp.]